METNAHIMIHVPASHTLDYLHPCKRFYRMQPSYYRLYTVR